MFTLDALIAMEGQLDGRKADRWADYCDDIVTAASAATSTAQVLDVLANTIGLAGSADLLDSGRGRVASSHHGDDLTALIRVAPMCPDPAAFEVWLRDHLAPARDPDGVLLSSIHRVKGLEWDHVIVFGADRDTMPHRLSDDTEEERRVFHVALTRGRKTVTVLADSSKPSPFLRQMQEEAGEEVGPGVARRFQETPVASLVDQELRENLKRWRLEKARTLGVPAFVIFNDRTLDALATLRPQDERSLLAVPGVGPAKLETYGDDLLGLLADE